MFLVLSLLDWSHPDLLTRLLPLLPLLSQVQNKTTLDCTDTGICGCNSGLGLHYLQQESKWTFTLCHLAQLSRSSDISGHMRTSLRRTVPEVSMAAEDLFCGPAPTISHNVWTGGLPISHFHCDTRHLFWLVSGPDQRGSLVFLPGPTLLSRFGHCKSNYQNSCATKERTYLKFGLLRNDPLFFSLVHLGLIS